MKKLLLFFFSLLLLISCRLMEIDDSHVQNVELGDCYENNNLLTFESFNEDSIYYKENAWGFYKMEVPIYWYNDRDEIQAYSEKKDNVLTIFLMRNNTFEIPKEKCFRPLLLTLIKVDGISKIKVDSLEYSIVKEPIN
jgi:hypothetical protein